MYCGTYANQQALYMALHRRAEQRGFDLARRGLAGFDDPSALAVVASEHAHLSLRHAVRMLGLGEQSLVLVPAGRNHRLDPDRLRTTLESLAGGHDVFAIVLTAGNTATGSVDPILPAVRLCRGLGTWLHVDGAYGLAYSLVHEFRPLFEGFARADSVSWDPHKQMGVPVPNSVLFVRRKADFARMAIYGEYFNRKDDPAPNPGLKSPPTTRPMAALPLVASLRHQGLDRVIARLKGPCLAVRGLARRLRGEPDIDLVNDPDTGILCFRMTPPGCSPDRLDALQKRLFERITAEGRRSISITRIHGRVVLRLVAISPAVTERALWKTVVRLRELAKEESGFSRRRS
jgi:glutamate/tyrosine decarboxylase-like PLP-dependent enzyme